MRALRTALALAAAALCVTAASATAQSTVPVLGAPADGFTLVGDPVGDTAHRSATLTFTASVPQVSEYDDDAELIVSRDPSISDAGELSGEPVVYERMNVDAAGTGFSLPATVQGLPGPYYWQVAYDGAVSGVRTFTVTEPAPTPPPDIKAKRGQITPAGFRGMRIGMKLRKAARVGKVRFTKVQRMPGSRCAYTSIRKRKVSVMLQRGRIVRFETRFVPGRKPSRVRGLGGIRVGDGAFKIEQTFGTALRRTQHTYVPKGWYYDVDYTAGKYKGRSIRFETGGDGRVTQVIAGRTSATRLVEGCA